MLIFFILLLAQHLEMLFSSGFFLVYFLPAYILGYLLIPEKFKNAFLLTISILFYWWGAPLFSIVLLGTSTLNFYIAKKIPLNKNPKRYLTLYILTNLGLLAYFKYSNFFIENTNLLLEQIGYQGVQWTKVILPIGISFFTFQSITYGVDVYRKVAEPQKKLLNYWLYILFFPQLIAGPIVTYSSIAKQLTHRETNTTKILDGLFRFTIGLAKKVLIANAMANLAVDLNVYQTHEVDSFILSWIIALAYTFEIYFDFSGYSDMAIGLGKMVGFDFPENFNRPYLSTSITEFWRRWHITLGNFMKNYLYIPLGGNKTSVNRTYVNLATVFVLSGLWHGAAWNFIAWGVFHGAWLIFERINPIKLKASFKPLKILITFIIVLHGWVLFNATSFGEAFHNLQQMYNFEHFTYWTDKNRLYYEIHLIIAALICLAGLYKPFFKIYTFSFGNSSIKSSVLAFSVLLFFSFLCLSHLIAGSFNPFIYFQF